MQKVSKQSLAMIALSILLAISIALTFTFAALKDSKTATGTITFSSGFTLTEKGAASFTITPTYNGDTVSYAVENDKGFTIKNDTKGQLIVEIGFTLTPAQANALNGKDDPVALKKTETYKVTLTAEASKDILVKDLLTVTSSNAEDVQEMSQTLTYEVKITVKVVGESNATEYTA